MEEQVPWQYNQPREGRHNVAQGERRGEATSDALGWTGANGSFAMLTIQRPRQHDVAAPRLKRISCLLLCDLCALCGVTNPFGRPYFNLSGRDDGRSCAWIVRQAA